MPAAQIPVDISAFDLGAGPINLIGSLRSATLEFLHDMGDGGVITRYGRVNQAVKKRAVLRTTLMSTSVSPGAPVKATNLNVTAFTADGIAYVGLLREGSIEFSYSHDEASGVADVWAFPQLVSRDIRIRGTLVVPSSMTATLMAAAGLIPQMVAATVTDARMTVTVTIDGTSFTLPMVIERCAHVFEDGRVAMFEVEFAGEDPGTGSYPTAPSGTTTLLQQVINAPATAMAMTLTSKSSGGVTYNGNFLPTRCSISIQDAAAIPTDYEFASQGVIQTI